jgi:hypothetical protein
VEKNGHTVAEQTSRRDKESVLLGHTEKGGKVEDVEQRRGSEQQRTGHSVAEASDKAVRKKYIGAQRPHNTPGVSRGSVILKKFPEFDALQTLCPFLGQLGSSFVHFPRFVTKLRLFCADLTF